MKMIIRRSVALLFIFIFLMTSLPILGICSLAAEDPLAYHLPGSSYKELSLAELIEEVTGSIVTEAEERYLLLGGESFRYTDRIPTTAVHTAYRNGVLTVTAEPYGYTAENKEKLIWIPTKLTVSGEKAATFVKTGEHYTATLSDVDVSKELLLTVGYQMTVTIAPAVWSELSNRAYEAGIAVLEGQKQYENAYQAYLDGIKSYEDYRKALVKYQEELTVYNAYLKDLEKYQKEWAEYTAFLDKKAAYDKATADYQKYLTDQAAYDKAFSAYQAYLAEKQKYDALYPTYQKYLTACQAAKDKMYVMDAVFLTDSAKHQMYATLMGNTVATVVSKKQLLIEQGGCDARDIDNAGNATVALKELLSAYKELKTDRERFAYYQAHYTEIRDQFILLYSSLNSLYKNGPVRAVLSSEGKLERYQNFIAHLYVLSTCFDDETTMSYDWVVYKANKPLAEVLVLEQHLVDRNASDPTGTVYPEEDMTLTAPTPVASPTNKPAVVQEPTKTWVEELKEPVKPAEQKQPIEPQEFLYPSEPQKPTFAEMALSLAKEIEAGTLVKRDTSQKAELHLDASLDLPLIPSDYPTVAFYDWDGKLLNTVKVESGSSVDDQALPERPATAKYSYHFAGWKTYDGEDVDLSNIRQSVSVYAHYKEELNSYTICWNVDGKISRTTVRYGELPVPPVVPTKASDVQYHYDFSGWSTPLSVVIGDMEYIAQFRKTPISYTVTFRYLDQSTEYKLCYGEMPTAPIPPADYQKEGVRYRFDGWDKTIGAVTGDVVYTAVYNVIPPEKMEIEERPSSYLVTVRDALCDMPALFEMATGSEKGLEIKLPAGTISLSADAVKKLSGIRTFTFQNPKKQEYILSAETEEGAIETLSAPVLLQLPYTVPSGSLVKVFLISKTGEEQQLNCDQRAGVLSFWANATGKYVVREFHPTALTASGSGVADVDQAHAAPGEKVTVHWTADPGIKVGSFTVVDENGEPVQTTGYSFVMPEGAVRIHIAFEEIVYTVRFTVDGREYARAEYHYGETVALPQPPEKQAEEGYVYTFSGWSPTVEMVTEDAEYTAQFKKTEQIHPNDVYKSPYNSNKIFTIYLPIAGGVVLFLVGIAAAVWALKMVKKRKNKS